MLNLDDDIQDYNEVVEKLQKENRALKAVLNRYQIFSDYSSLPNLDVDLKSQLDYTEQLLETCFSELLIPAFAGALVFSEDGLPCDFVYTNVNNEFLRFCDIEMKDILGKKESELKKLKSPIWIDGIFKAAKILEPISLKVREGEEVFDVKINALKHDIFYLQFKPNNSNALSERKLKENLTFTQKIVNAIPIPMFYKNLDGYYVLCNDSYAKTITGGGIEDISGKTAKELSDYIPKEYADFYQNKDLELLKEKGIQVYEGPLKCADGKIRVFIVSKTLVKDTTGKAVGILGVMQNIDEMIKTRRELAESESRYKTLFNSLLEPIIVADIDGNIIMCNSKAIELFEEEYDPKTGIKQVPAEFLADKNLIRSVIETGETMTRRVPLILQGEQRWFLSRLQPLSDSFGEKVVQIISDDITELKRYQGEILKQKVHAEDSSNLKTIFLANIAHETRTPANIISGHVQMIQSGLHPEKLDSYLAAIYKNTGKLLDIIDDIVELSKIESGQIKLRHEICSINSIIEDAYAYLCDIHEEAGKKLELKRCEQFNEYESLIYADNQYISQVLKKLLTNAVTFTQKGYIELGARFEDQKLVFYVEDTGIGIPKEKINIIFERFRQADEGMARQYGGNGLGLAIANELVKRMGGELNVESTVAKGSVFSFSIPYKKAGM